MISKTDLSSKTTYDVKSMPELRDSGKVGDPAAWAPAAGSPAAGSPAAGSPAALKSAATQFEALFLNMMMKSMREATPQDSIMDSPQSKMYTSMLDQQTSQNLAKRGTGLADMLLRQLSQPGMPAEEGAGSLRASSMAAALEAFRAQQNAAAPAVKAVEGKSAGSQAPHVRAFQDKLAAHADEASRVTGIPAKFMLGQAALESGWGKREIKGRDGVASNNLFGIKAGPEWKGKVAEALTTEYVNGVPRARVEKFRAYDSYADSFKDYAKLITGNKRYEKVLASAADASSFAHGLQRAGYATDPHYATKLTRIIKNSLVG